MSRIRSTLDTVSKAVSGTVSGTDLLSKISKLKPGTSTTAAAAAAGKAGTAGTVEVHIHGTTEQEAATVSMTAAAVQSAIAIEMPKQDKKHEEEVPEQGVTTEQVEVPHVRVREKLKISLASQAGTVSSSVAKQTFQRLQPAAFSTNMDETYSHLSQHVNTYFGSDTPADPAESQFAQQRKGLEGAAPSAEGPYPNQTLNRDHIPVLMPVAGKAPNQASPESSAVEHTSPATPTPTPTSTSPAAPKPETAAPVTPPASPRKGISQYLSYPRPTVQSFVGSYIAPLVPKFRADAQSVDTTEKAGKPSGSDQVATQDGREKTEEEKEAEDKAQRLLSQRERVGSFQVI